MQNGVVPSFQAAERIGDQRCIGLIGAPNYRTPRRAVHYRQIKNVCSWELNWCQGEKVGPYTICGSTSSHDTLSVAGADGSMKFR